jgi:GNAT superfamily N-acetyltransferase
VQTPKIRWILTRVNYHIRPARPADADDMHRVHTSSVRALCASAYDPAVIDGWLRGRSAAGYMQGIRTGMSAVAESSNRVVGFCEAVAGEVLAVFVVPECAGHGIGASLLRHAVALAGGPGTPIELEATLNAVTFYERFGFRAVRPAVARRNDIEIPVVIMQTRG